MNSLFIVDENKFTFWALSFKLKLFPLESSTNTFSDVKKPLN
jgi:hypothetical protein